MNPVALRERLNFQDAKRDVSTLTMRKMIENAIPEILMRSKANRRLQRFKSLEIMHFCLIAISRFEG